MAKTCVNFTAAQVLAALRGEVVVVREAVNPQPPEWARKATNVFLFQKNPNEFAFTGNHPNLGQTNVYPYTCPYAIGNTLWVRETWATARMHDQLPPSEIDSDASVWWMADKSSLVHLGSRMGKTRPSIFMPRWASRLNVTVQSVAVEQVDGGWEWVVEMVKAQP